MLSHFSPTLCNSMDRSPPGFSVYGVLQARIVEWVAMQGIFLTQGWNLPLRSPALAGGFLTTSTTQEAKVHIVLSYSL